MSQELNTLLLTLLLQLLLTGVDEVFIRVEGPLPSEAKK
jgi:hypothetical protein